MVCSIPHMEKSDADSIIRKYDLQSRDTGEIVDLDRDKDATDKLKGIFGK